MQKSDVPHIVPNRYLVNIYSTFVRFDVAFLGCCCKEWLIAQGGVFAERIPSPNILTRLDDQISNELNKTSVIYSSDTHS